MQKNMKTIIIYCFILQYYHWHYLELDMSK